MRKLLWCGVAASVVGVLGTGYLTWRHPDSLPGRCVHKVEQMSAVCSPMNFAARSATTEKSQDQVVAGHGCAAAADPVAEPCAAADEDDSLTHKVIAALNLSEEKPAAIVIHEDDVPPPLPEPMTRVDDEQVLEILRPLNNDLFTGLPDVDTDTPKSDLIVPPLMPYADEDEPTDCNKTLPPMPYADEPEDNNLTFWYEIGCRSTETTPPFFLYLDSENLTAQADFLMWSAHVRDCCVDVVADAAAEPFNATAWWVKMVWPNFGVEQPQGGYEQSEPKEEMEQPEMQTPHGDPYSEYHHAYCPYSGRSCHEPEDYHRTEPLPSTTEPKVDDEEVKLEKKHPSFLDMARSMLPMWSQPPAIDTPKHPEIDTMEFRPSDFNLEDIFGPLPF
jgi:hypothetical protein